MIIRYVFLTRMVSSFRLCHDLFFMHSRRSLFHKSRLLLNDQLCHQRPNHIHCTSQFYTTDAQIAESPVKNIESPPSQPSNYGPRRKINLEQVKKIQVDLTSLSNLYENYGDQEKVSARVVAERLNAINACIKVGQMLDAELSFHRLYRSNQLDLRNLLGAHVFNGFIEGYLKACENNETSHFQLNRAIEWFEKISKMGFKPNTETFTLLLYYFCRKNDIEQATHFLSLANAEPQVNVGVILSDDRFVNDPEAKTTFELVLKNQNQSLNSVDPIDALLMSVITEKQDFPVSEIITKGPTLRPLEADSSEIDITEGMKTFRKIFDDAEAEVDVPNAVKVQQDKEELVAKFESLLKTSSTGVQLLSRTLKKLVESNNLSERFKYEQQAWLEEESWRMAIEEANSAYLPEHMRQLSSSPRSLVRKMFHQIVPLVAAEMKKSFSANELHGPFFRMLKPEHLVLVLLNEVLRVPTSADRSRGAAVGDIKIGKLLLDIGYALEAEANLKILKEKRGEHSERLDYKVHTALRKGVLFDTNTRKLLERVIRKGLKETREKAWTVTWPLDVKLKISALLVSILIKSATVTVTKKEVLLNGTTHETQVEEPAFSRITERVSGALRQIGKLKFHPKLLEDMASSSDSILVIPKLLPMIVPPRPWLSYDSGGYLRHGDGRNFIRSSRNPLLKRLIREADERQYLSSIYHALDVLGSTVWQINKRVLDVATTCWNSGSEYATSAETILPLEAPENVNDDPVVRSQHRRAAWRNKNAERSRYSQRCDTNYKILIANAFANEKIYFPHYVDFRGRAYPLPSHFNHIGNDLCRGLLLFGESKELGSRGLNWLKIQIANLYGKDKLPFDERLKFVDENLDNIRDSAEKPLEGSRWWLTADSPWQLLAACYELIDALKLDDPTKYQSSLPIHQDGTCNGLQHYAALGGDVNGAKLVNLVPSEEPSDVYSGIANRVAELVEKDALNGIKEAILMRGKVTRKIVKQTVMTNTYGVTAIGAREQVASKLGDLQKEGHLTHDQVFPCSSFISSHIFHAVGSLFSSAHATQVWLNKAARIIASSVPVDQLDSTLLVDREKVVEMGVPLEDITLSPCGKQEWDENSRSAFKEPSKDDLLALMESVRKDREEKEASEKKTSEREAAAKKSSAKKKAANPVDEEEEEEEEEEDDIQVDKRGQPLRMTTVTWTTPLGLPVVQPYRNFKSRVYKTNLQSICLYDDDSPAAVNSVKQSTAFPPNFIHSLDASHMMLTAIACKNQGLEFASVHDSYWTHACDVDKMNTVLREAFVTLHKRDLMRELKDEFETRYASHRIPVTVQLRDDNVRIWNEYLVEAGRAKRKSPAAPKKNLVVWIPFELPPLPQKGGLDIDVVKDSKYFFH